MGHGSAHGCAQMVKSLSVVIPVFRSEGTLPELYRQLTASLEQLAVPYEIILVEDCGGDRAWDAICDLATHDRRVRGIGLSRNYGQQNALLCGIRAARYDVVVTMDDDLQHPPDQIHLLLDALAGGRDVVYGVPHAEQHGLLRNIASRLTKLALQNAMGAENARNVSAFRAFRTGLRDAFDSYRSPSVSIDVLLSWGTKSFGSIVVRHDARRVGTSNYTWAKLINHAFNLMTGFSTLPLRMASITGFVFTFFGLAVLVWVIGIYLVYGSAVPGFVFLATLIAVFSGVQLFALGIFGEYLARIFSRSIEKPAYVVRYSTSQDPLGNVEELGEKNRRSA